LAELNDPAPSEADKPLTRSERVLVRISILQTVIAVASIFIGVVALYAALNEADATRKQQEATVWPDLMVGAAYASGVEDGKAVGAFRINLANSGIGPARIRTMRVTADGKAQPNWRSTLNTLLGAGEPSFSMDISHRTLLPGGPSAILTVRDPVQAKALADIVLHSNRLQVEACYCSMFDDCWLSELAGAAGEASPNRPVTKCPDYGAERFLQ
jgi:hypothetical protein